MKSKAEVEEIIVAALKEADPAEFGSDGDNGGEERAGALGVYIADKLVESGAISE